MNFFTIDPALKETIENGSYPVKIKLLLTFKDQSQAEIPHTNIIQALIISRFTSPGVITTNTILKFTHKTMPTPTPEVEEARIYFSCGDCDIYLLRFTLTPNDKNLVTDETGARTPLYTLNLEDTPARIKRLGAIPDWTTTQMVIDSTLCDKEYPDSSLFHIIAAKAGIVADETESCTIDLSLPYINLTRSPWTELCDLTDAVHATLEGGCDKKLILSQSRYQEETTTTEEIPSLHENKFYKVTEETAGEKLKNDIRLRWNKPERLTHCILWEYTDPPINYTATLKALYPFCLEGEKRAIETDPDYQAPYTAQLPEGGEAEVVYADQLDTETTVAARMEHYGHLSVSSYNTDAYPNKALINLTCDGDDNLQMLQIEGRPIIIRKNSSCYLHDDDSITEHGLKTLNRTGKYFLNADIDGIPHYEDWTEENLRRNKTLKKRYKAESQYCLFHLRTGSLTNYIKNTGETITCTITSLTMEYNTTEGFILKTTLLEEK
ncbi:MAG: hypothetical protein JEY99_15215 [Spirochaetales bacterium]|nr:hypothetical protein [Spirochaetales bacterium]